MIRVHFIAVFCVATLISAGPTRAEYDKNSVPALTSAMVSTCGLGNAAISAGSTPTAIAGVTLVSAQQAKCLMDRYSQSLLVIGAMSDLEQLPDAFPVPILGYDKPDAEFEKKIATDFTPLTGGRKDRPVLIYCHHASCQFSANGSEHLVRMGYTRIFWLRDGTKGWRQAGYKFADTPRAAPGQSATVAYFKAASAHTFGCFGESNASACEKKIALEQQAYNSQDIKPEEKPIVLDALLNTVAAYGRDLRTGGVSRYFPDPRFPKNLQKSLEVVTPAVALMRKAQASGAHPNATANNVKLLGEAILGYAEAGRWPDFTTTLKFVREMADQNFASLNLVRSDEKKLREAKSRLVSAEQLEEQVSTTLSKRALDAYKTGNLTEAEKLSGLAHTSYAHRLEGITRSGDEGVAGFADLSATSRMADLKLEQGELYIAAGKKKEAEITYQAARSVSCPFISDATHNLVKNKEPISDTQQYAHFKNCRDAEFGEMKATGELDRQIQHNVDAQLRLYYSLNGLDYDKIRAETKAKN